MAFIKEFSKIIIFLTSCSFLFHLLTYWVENAIDGFSTIHQVEVINISEVNKDVQKVEVINHDDFQRK